MSATTSEKDAATGRDGGNFTRDFLFAATGIIRDGSSVHTTMIMEERLEGWRGIPHGGIAMGAVMELAALLGEEGKEEGAIYPRTADFRLGGARVRIGDEVAVKVWSAPEGIRGTISLPGETAPYLSAVIGCGHDDLQRRDAFLSYLPGIISNPEDGGIPLPYYRNCFVCGIARRHPGLQRQFWLRGNPDAPCLAYAVAGFAAGDRDSFYRFSTGCRLAPLPALAILDETMGWAGFIATASGAVTVRIGYTFYRDIRVGEKIVFFGKSEKVRGSAASRLLFWTSGGAAVVDDQGRCEPVIAAAAQYLGVAELTGQMRRELIPEELTTRAFRLAGLAD